MKNGRLNRDSLNIYRLFDIADAWALAQNMPPENMRDTVRGDLIVAWAWMDLDKALTAAEQEPQETCRRELVWDVAIL